jgi:hypothetical protein
MRTLITIVLVLTNIVASNAQGETGRVQRNIGNWAFIAQPANPPPPDGFFDVCQIENLTRANGWSFALTAHDGDPKVTLRHNRLRPNIGRNEVIIAIIGGLRVRMQVDRPVANFGSPGGGIVLSVVDDQAFYQGMQLSQTIEISVPGEGNLRWPATGADKALAAFSGCHR